MTSADEARAPSTGVPACHYCGVTSPAEGEPFDKDRELRPYGPGGSWVCHPCAFATPERAKQAEAAFGALLEGAEAVSPHGVAVIGQESGPQPLDLHEKCVPGGRCAVGPGLICDRTMAL